MIYLYYKNGTRNGYLSIKFKRLAYHTLVDTTKHMYDAITYLDLLTR
mgnify:CR=1 FL=1